MVEEEDAVCSGNVVEEELLDFGVVVLLYGGVGGEVLFG